MKGDVIVTRDVLATALAEILDPIVDGVNILSAKVDELTARLDAKDAKEEKRVKDMANLLAKTKELGMGGD